jgi:hypothetical protein
MGAWLKLVPALAALALAIARVALGAPRPF